MGFPERPKQNKTKQQKTFPGKALMQHNDPGKLKEHAHRTKDCSLENTK